MPNTTHNLYLSDGTTTASLVSEDVYLTGYTPIPPRSTATGWQDVTESARIVVQAATTVLIQYRIREIEKLLLQGADRQRNPAQERVFVYLQLANESELWRSEILGGRVELDDSAVGLWNSRTIEATVIWTRRYYWEGEEEEAALSVAGDFSASELETPGELSESGVDTFGVTGGVTVQNCGSASWWEPEPITGSIPAGTRIEITPNSTEPVHHFWIGHSVGNSGLFDHHYEGEDATGGSQLPGSPDTANYSGGYYRRVNVTATSLTAALTFAISTLNLSYADGGYYEILLRYAGSALAAGSVYLQARIEYAGIELWRGPEVANGGIVVDSLGTVQLPPTLQNTGFGILSEVDLVIYARVPSTAVNLDVDFMHLIGAMQSRFLDPIQVITGFTTPVKVVDDGLDDALWFGVGIVTDPNDLRVPGFVGIGPRMTITPGVRNRFYLLSSEVSFGGGGLDPTDITRTVRMYYRPRRVTV